MSSHIVRIVHKDKSNQQYFHVLDQSDLPALGPSSVRIQSRLIGLSSSNIAYCALGPFRGDWELFPIPPSLQMPDNSHDKYGIAPTWGYAEVLSSDIPMLPQGTMIWGFIPTSAHPIDLRLEQSNGMSTNWVEVSEHRARMPAMYQQYKVVDQPFTAANETLSKFTASWRPTWESGYLLSRFCFAVPPIEPVSPAGIDASWTTENSNLETTVIMALGAGSRSCRAFLHQLLVNRNAEHRPAGFLGITESTRGVSDADKAPFPTKMIPYAEAQSAALEKWMKEIDFNRILLIDFGGRDNILTKLLPHLQQTLPDKKVDIVAFGVEMKVQTGEGFVSRTLAVGKELNIPVFRTGDVQEGAMKQLGEKGYYEEMKADFERVIKTELVRSKEDANKVEVLGMQLNEKQGMRGENGLEQAWKDLFGGYNQKSIAIVVDLRDLPGHM